MMLEVFAEEALIREMEPRGYLLNGEIGSAQEHFGLHHHITVDPFAGSASTCLSHHRAQMLGSDA